MKVQPGVNVYRRGMCEHAGHGQMKWYVHEEFELKFVTKWFQKLSFVDFLMVKRDTEMYMGGKAFHDQTTLL